MLAIFLFFSGFLNTSSFVKPLALQSCETFSSAIFVRNSADFPRRGEGGGGASVYLKVNDLAGLKRDLY